MTTRLTRLISLVLLLWLPATAAHADPAGPTNYRSTLTSVPDVDGVSVEVFGGDAFLVLQVDPGHEVIVHGYEHRDAVVDPYLRFSSDGTVEANLRSPARWKNLDRYEAVEIPDFVDPSAPADWEVVATDGGYAWHDHRIHWMSSALPPTIDPDGGVQVVPALADWSVPITIDGVAHEITGTLTWEPSPTPLPWAAMAIVVAGVLAVLGRGRPTTAMLIVGGAAVLALVVGVAAGLGLPPGVGRVLPLMILPAATLLALGVARARSQDVPLPLVAAAALPLVGWVILQWGALTSPIVPSAVPVGVIRLAVAAAAGAALGAVVVAVTQAFGGDLADLADLAED